MSRVQDALDLAAAGYHVFPVHDKVPYTKRGLLDATRDEERIRTWWKRWPQANISVNCGMSGIAVLDADSKHGADPDAVFQRLGVEGDVPIIRTGVAPDRDDSHPNSLAGVRGAHALFAGKLPTQPKTAIPGVEIRGDGAYVVAPPSRHESGVQYEGRYPPVHELPPVPESVLAILLGSPTGASPGPAGAHNGNQPAGGPGGLAGLLSAPPDPGGRNVWLAAVAGHYARCLPNHADYVLHVREVAGRLEPPLPEAEIAKLLSSIWSAEDRKFERLVQEREFSLRVTEEARARLRAVEFRPPEVAASFAEVLARPRPDVAWAVEGLAGVGQNVLLAAQFKAGKTTLQLNLARAMVDGEKFLGQFETHLDGRLCYLNYELTDDDAQAWIADIGFRRPERALLVGLRGQPNPLATPEGRRWLIGFLAEHEVEFLIIDTFRASYTGDSHNDNAQMARFTRLLDEIKAQAGVSGLVLSHHFGRKLHDQGREHGQGAVELDNWADMRWIMTVGADHDRFLRVDGRGLGLEESQLQFDPHSRKLWLPAGGIGVSRSSARESSARDTIVLLVRRDPGITSRELREAAKRAGGSTSEEFNDAIRELVSEGGVQVVDGPRGSKLHYLPQDVPAQSSLGVEE